MLPKQKTWLSWSVLLLTQIALLHICIEGIYSMYKPYFEVFVDWMNNSIKSNSSFRQKNCMLDQDLLEKVLTTTDIPKKSLAESCSKPLAINDVS
jgi:hypothetical protein